MKACYLSGEQEDKEVKESVKKGMYQIVNFTPEMILGSQKWRSMLLGEIYSSRLRAFIIDEAHTVKKWLVIRGGSQGGAQTILFTTLITEYMYNTTIETCQLDYKLKCKFSLLCADMATLTVCHNLAAPPWHNSGYSPGD